MTPTSELAARLRQIATAIYIAADKTVADDVANVANEAADALDRLAVGGDMETTPEERRAALYTTTMSPGWIPAELSARLLRDFDRLQTLLSAANAEVAVLTPLLEAANADVKTYVAARARAVAERDAANDRIAALEAYLRDHGLARTLLSGAQT